MSAELITAYYTIFCYNTTDMKNSAILVVLLLTGAASATETKALFNGKDLTGWYTYLNGYGRNHDPKNVISVSNGVIRISGEAWGALVTEGEYENYRLTVEYRWLGTRLGSKAAKAFDSGILFHSVGADGAFYGTWLASHEFNLVQGATGDFWTVHPKGSDMFLKGETADWKLDGKYHVWKKGGPEVTLSGNDRLCRFDISPSWDNRPTTPLTKDERPAGEWNTAVLECRGDAVSAFLNGHLVNQATHVKPAKGKIQLQSEGCGIEFRKITIQELASQAR